MYELLEQLNHGGTSRHETFTPRYGWLKKGYEAARKDPVVFSLENAIELLGVGKNMVRSIRSWCLAFSILEYEEGEAKRGGKGALRPTSLGDSLLSDGGWDPYLEDIASLWLLNYQLFLPPYESVSWSLAFNHCTLPYFDIKQLTQILISAAKQYEKLSNLSEGSFEKDASCIIRMYANANDNGHSEISCPFSQLGLVRASEETKYHRFSLSSKDTLPSLVFLACCLMYAALTQPAQRTMSLHKIVFEFNSPGVVFKISESEAGRLLEDASKNIKGVELVESIGSRQLQFESDPTELYWAALEEYYQPARLRSKE